MIILGLSDFILSIPFILVLMLLGALYTARSPLTPEEKKIFMTALIYRFFMMIFYLVLTTYFYGFGDNYTYFRESLEARNMVSDGSLHFWEYLRFDYKDYVSHEWYGAGSNAGVIVEKISFLLTYLSFKNYLVNSLLFCFICYFGVWKMYLTFNRIAPDMRKLNGIIVLFLPTVTIYGSPILKDSIGIFALGYIVYYAHVIFSEKKYRLRYFLSLACFIYLLYTVRSFVALALLSPLAIVGIFRMFALARKNIAGAFGLFMLYTLTAAVLFALFFDKLQTKIIEDFINELKFNKLQYESIGGGSNFNNNVTENFTFTDLIVHFPQGIFNVIFRPFILEARSPLMLLSGLENLYILILILRTVLKTKFGKFLRYLADNPLNLYLLVFSLFFCGFVSYYSSNFGTISRYRIPGLPLFLFGILAVRYMNKRSVTDPGRACDDKTLNQIKGA